MADKLLVIIRDAEVAQAISSRGFNLVPPSTGTPHFGLACTRAVSEWGGAFLALTPELEALPQALRDRGLAGDVLVPTHSVLMALHLPVERPTGIRTPQGQ